MKKIFMVLAGLIMLACESTAVTAAKNNGATKGFDWSSVIEAIIQVESEGNPRAKSGNSVGAMQITPILVAECNALLKQQKSKKRYSLEDRYSVQKSKEMFLLIQSAYNPGNSIEKAIRAWNGGNHYSVRGTQRYYEKVMRQLRKLKK